MADDRTAFEELVALDAAGALDSAEQRELRRRLADAPADERAAIARLYDLAARTAIAEASAAGVQAPPSGLRDRLMERVNRSRFYSVCADEGVWVSAPLPGIKTKLLSLNRERNTATLLMRVEPGTRYPPHHHSGAEDCYVISGDVVSNGRTHHAGDFIYAEAGSDHSELYSETGAEVLLVVAATDYM